MSILSVFATIYIKMTLKKNKIFNKTVYQKFIFVCFISVMVALLLFILVILSFIQLAKVDIIKWYTAIESISRMSSGSTLRNVFETICTLTLVIGLYVLITISNIIEDEIRHLEAYKKKLNKNDVELF